MEINTETQGGVVQLQAVAQANQLAFTQQIRTLSAQGVTFDNNNAPNVNTSPSYSPALYAQAAQYQLYTQSGSLASLMGVQNVGIANHPLQGDDETEIHAVESTEATHIDTQA